MRILGIARKPRDRRGEWGRVGKGRMVSGWCTVTYLGPPSHATHIQYIQYINMNENEKPVA